MLQISEIIKAIENKLRTLELPKEPAGLYDPVTYMFSIGGKRIRPALSLMASNLFKDDISDCMEPALAMEVFHNFTLMHDDIMDHAAMRRGMPSVHEKWNLNTAILSGDVMLVKSYELLSSIKNQNLRLALNVFNDTAARVCEGQQLDVEFEQQSIITPDDYISMITKKTAVLLGCSLYCGAIAAGANVEDANLLFDTGMQAGISFQIKDDVLDAYGDEKLVGKTIGGDILQHKKTYLFVRTYQLADDEDKSDLLRLYNNDKITADEKVKQVMQLFEKYHAKSEAEAEMKKYYAIAHDVFRKVNVTEERKQILMAYLDAVYTRNF